jgi:hypothetical protein
MHNNFKGDNRQLEEKGKTPKLLNHDIPHRGISYRNILKKLSYS